MKILIEPKRPKERTQRGSQGPSLSSLNQTLLHFLFLRVHKQILFPGDLSYVMDVGKRGRVRRNCPNPRTFQQPPHATSTSMFQALNPQRTHPTQRLGSPRPPIPSSQVTPFASSSHATTPAKDKGKQPEGVVKEGYMLLCLHKLRSKLAML